MSLIYHLAENVLEDYNCPEEDDLKDDCGSNQDFEEYDHDKNLAALAAEVRKISEEHSISSEDELSCWSSDDDNMGKTERSNCEDENLDGLSPIDMYYTSTKVSSMPEQCYRPKFDFPLPLSQSVPGLEFVFSEPCLLAVACIQSEDRLGRNTQKFSVTEEASVIREVLHMLIGLPGQLFDRIDVEDDNDDFEAISRQYFPRDIPLAPFTSIFVPRKGIVVRHLSPAALQSILRWYGQQGSMLYYLAQASRKFVLPLKDEQKACSPRLCTTIQAFFSSVYKFLSDFETYIQEILHAHLYEGQVVLPSVVQIDGLGASKQMSKKTTRITLLSLQYLLRPRLDQISDICCLVQCVLDPVRLQWSNAQQASYLLQQVYNVLHESKISGDPNRIKLFARLFADTFTPYVLIMDDWLFHGSLACDVNNEFFVCSLDLSSTSRDRDDFAEEYLEGEKIRFWQKFAIRDGGDIVHDGKLRGATSDYLSLHSSASTSDAYYSGMSIALDLHGDGTFSETGIITAYFGAKRRAIVEFGKKLTVSEGCPYFVSAMAPQFLQDMAFHILSAGKSLNVLVLECDSNSRMFRLVHQQPALRKCFQAFDLISSGLKGERSTYDSDLHDTFDTGTFHRSAKDAEGLSCQGSAEGNIESCLICQEREHRFEETVWFDPRPDSALKLLFSSSLEKSDVWARPTEAMPFEFTDEHSYHGTALPCSSLSLFLSGCGNDTSRIRYVAGATLSGCLDDSDPADRLVSNDAMLLPQILDRCFLRHVKRRVRELNSALVNHLMQRHRLTAHLAALRRIFFMEAGDILHAFSLELFRKLDCGEAWGDAHALDVMLQSSLPPIPGVELGSVSAYMLDGASRTAPGIMALDRLRLSYSVKWPLNLVIDSSSLIAYNAIMVFLMQIKRAKCALDHMRDKPFARPHRVGEHLKHEDIKDMNDSVLQRYGCWNSRYLLLRMELRHVVNNVENYVMSQIHGNAASNLERQLLEATALDQVGIYVVSAC